MDAQVKKHHKRPINWSDEKVVEELGINLETLLELIDKDEQSLALVTEVPQPVVHACLAGTIKSVVMEHLEAIANEFGITPEEIDLLAKADFETEDERVIFWRSHLQAKGLMLNRTTDSNVGLSAPETVEDSVVIATESSEVSSVQDDEGLEVETEETEEDKPVTQADIGQNIRAAVARVGRKLLETLEESGISPATNKRFLFHYEQGKENIDDEQLQALAELLNVDVSVFQTGEGLEEFRPRPKTRNALVPVGAKTVVLPAISDEMASDWFRSRIMRKNTERAEGLPPGTLKSLLIDAMNGEHDDSKWSEEWFGLTKEGANVSAIIDEFIEKTKNWNDVLKVAVITRIAKDYWPSG